MSPSFLERINSQEMIIQIEIAVVEWIYQFERRYKNE